MFPGNRGQIDLVRRSFGHIPGARLHRPAIKYWTVAEVNTSRRRSATRLRVSSAYLAQWDFKTPLGVTSRGRCQTTKSCVLPSPPSEATSETKLRRRVGAGIFSTQLLLPVTSGLTASSQAVAPPTLPIWPTELNFKAPFARRSRCRQALRPRSACRCGAAPEAVENQRGLSS